ncbi:MAG TPA: hypothetical protein PKD85_18895, partial [Saprospiraceae bacterium]|nr:hypothetical protein [Saprospiraceae bacterium]
MKVHLKNGEDKWFLVHLEVQSYRDKDLEDRMFTYYYRIRDRYHKEVTAWVILADESQTYRPQQYQAKFFGTEIIYNFNVFKIINQDETILKESNNIFATIVLTVLLYLKNKKKLKGDSLV